MATGDAAATEAMAVVMRAAGWEPCAFMLEGGRVQPAWWRGNLLVLHFRMDTAFELACRLVTEDAWAIHQAGLREG